MKIALYVNAWSPDKNTSGIQTYASNLVPALRKLGHEVFVLTFHKDGEDTDPYTIDLRRFSLSRTLWHRAMYRFAPARTLFNDITTSIASALSELIDERGLDVFEIENSLGWSYAIGQKALLPIVVRIHGLWHLMGRFTDHTNVFYKNRRRQKWEARGLRCAQFFTAPSVNALEFIKHHYDFGPTAGRVIRNPIETVVKDEMWTVRNSTRDKILFVGRFDELKGGDLVLRAFAELAELYPRLTLTFVGPDVGLYDAKGRRTSFHQFVKSSLPKTSQERIDFPGPMSRRDIMHLRREHFLTVVASRHEVMPYSVLEPMSLGCPVVATHVGGIPEMITDKRNGLLVPPEDAKAMALACQKLLENPIFAARIGLQAWQDCQELCAPELIARQTIGVYQEAIDKFKSHFSVHARSRL